MRVPPRIWVRLAFWRSRTGIHGHPAGPAAYEFGKQSDPAARRMQKIHFDKNVSLIGGLLAYALTEGR